MTWRVRQWIAATVAIAATGLMVGLAIAAMTGVDQGHTRMSAADSKGGIAYQHNIAARDRIV
jgi:NO-binding membrane sensor protein with MHYT domain